MTEMNEDINKENNQKKFTYSGIVVDDQGVVKEKVLGSKVKCGDFVKVRPCGNDYDGKTFLGIMIGELPLTISANRDERNGKIVIRRSFYNPAILVPEIGKVVYGCGSWWGKIDSHEELEAITDADIDDVWYVKLSKALAKSKKAEEMES